MASVQAITPCLWFDTEAEEAVRFYVSVFPDAAVEAIARYGKEGFDVHGKPAGSVLTVSFRLLGQEFLALNGGPHFKFSEAVSFIVHCEDQAEIDRYWAALGDGGDPNAQQCGWLKDKFGLSWQIVPRDLPGMMAGPDSAKSERVMKTLLQMKKLEIAALKRAYEGTMS
jgi:predicted 3-demethylubiquinone-9 3-methyltransferase (glyoxalase superfamily)